MITKRILLKLIVFYLLSFTSTSVFSQIILLGPQEFNTDFIVHGSTAPVITWFAPDYNTPIDYSSSGGCTGGYAGYSGSWNNYWGNFLRTPQVNCTGLDSVILSFDMSNSYFSSHPLDKVYFNMWIDGAYHDASTNQTIYFDVARNCVHFEVVFVLTPYTNKNVLFYLNTSCGYNDSQVYMVKFDNIEIYTFETTGLKSILNNQVAINVFPIPSNDFTTLLFPNPENKTHTLLIYNTMGQVMQKIENITDSEVRIENRDMQGGLYFFKLQDKNKTVGLGKFIIQ